MVLSACEVCLDLVRQEELGLESPASTLSGVGTEQLGLQGLELGGVDIEGRDGQQRGRLGAGHIDRRGGQLPREGDRLGRVVDGLVTLLRRRGLAAVQDVDL